MTESASTAKHVASPLARQTLLDSNLTRPVAGGRPIRLLPWVQVVRKKANRLIFRSASFLKRSLEIKSHAAKPSPFCTPTTLPSWIRRSAFSEVALPWRRGL